MKSEDLRKKLDYIRNDGKACKRIYEISFVCALLILVLIVKNNSEGGSYIVDGKGNVIGISRGSLSESEEYQVELRIDDGEEEIKKEFKINKSPVSKNNKSEDEDDQDESDRDAEINGIISDIELSEKKNIYFPEKLSDGSKLSWRSIDKTDSSLIIIACMYIILVFLVIQSALNTDKDKDREKKKAVLRSLPRFTNQVLMMMNAGIILSDALDRICESYRIIPESERDFFEAELIRKCEQNSDHRVSAASVISEFASEYNVKELMRISTILIENERRGCDVIDNLSRESRYLWDDRRIVAIEQGKLIDTKMAYPLGMLLVLLIVITMAPALLSM